MRPQFVPDRGRTGDTPWGAVVLLVLVGALLWARPIWQPRAEDGVLIEVVGDVPAPAFYHVRPPTLSLALAMAGSNVPVSAERTLRRGDRVVVTGSGVHVEPAGHRLVYALPLDPNVASVESLRAIPGVGQVTAEAMVTERTTRPFTSLVDLGERLGLSEARAMQLGDFLALQRGVVPPRKAIDINTASVAELERLPGIGPELAARVVAHRENHGAFTSIHGLEAVTGIGPATVKAIEAHLAAEEP